MCNNHLRNYKLSWRAKGIFSYILSLPDDWDIYMSELCKHSKEGKDAFRTSFKELENNGYIIKEKIKDEKSRFAGYKYTIIEVPKNNLLEELLNPENGNNITISEIINSIGASSKLISEFKKKAEKLKYSEYLKTPYWRAISNHIKNKENNKCSLCGSTENLNVHHKTYKNKGVEFLNENDLCCLCNKCHKKEHNITGE